MPGYLFVEGHGEVEAAHNLLYRLWDDLGLPPLSWQRPHRRGDLHLERGIRKACDIGRARDAEALLILRDEDDGCPAELAPRVAEWIRGAALPFPAAMVLFHREYEALFLPCLHLMAGKPLGDGAVKRPGLPDGVQFEGDPESLRGVKEWLSKELLAGRSYKPSLDQLPMTRMLDFEVLRQSSVSCFGSLERALKFLAAHLGQTGAVYPPPGGVPAPR